ncbi:MAG: leucyl aminopeptidase [Bacteroidota bacterium]
MTLTVLHADPATLEADLLIVPDDPSEAELPLRAAFGDAYARAADDADRGTEPVVFYPPARSADRIVLCGLGQPGTTGTGSGADTGDELERLRRAAGRGGKLARNYKATRVGIVLPPGRGSEEAAALIEGFVLGSYRYERYRTTGEPVPEIETLTLVTEREDEPVRHAAERALATAQATCAARDLVNTVAADLTATTLGEETKALGKAHGFSVDVWSTKQIEDEGMGGLLAVNRGSLDDPAFIVLEHKPKDAHNERPIVLVGKAVTYDTGGLSLKPTKNSMDKMKADMAGGAAVIGAVAAATQLGLPLHIIGLVPSTDNRPGGRAYVPGDVVTMHDGSTVEVLNTDAEGRMLLADALSYAKRYDPAFCVSVATLTGAAVVALGTKVGAVLTSATDGAANRLDAFVEAGRRTGDLVAPLPMYDLYAEQLKSDVADRTNVGGREAGTVTAAKFLEHFTGYPEGYPWVHLDIAGPAFIGEHRPYAPKGGTGFGVRLLVDVLRHYDPSLGFEL